MKRILKFIQKFFFLIVMALLFTLLLLAAAFGQSPEHFRQALKHAEREQKKKALLAMENLPATTSADHFYRGYLFLKIQDKENARKAFEAGIAANEKDPLNHAGLGYLLMLEDKAADAKVSLDKALTLSKSKSTQILKVAAEAYLTNTRYAAEAVKLLEKAKEIDKDAETDLLLGDAFLLQNNGGLAVTSYEYAAKADPNSPTAHYKIGMTYVRSRNFTVAIEELSKAVSIDPTYTPAWKDLAELYYLTKEANKAVKAQETYLSLTEKPEDGQVQYAFYLFMAKNYTKANEIFSGVMAKENPSIITYRFYARSLAQSGDTLSSIKMYDEYFTKAKPNETEASDYSFYANLLRGLGQDSLAAVYYEKSLAIDRHQPEVLQLTADIYYKTKKYPQAIGTYESLINQRTKPLSQDYYNLGRAYYYNSDFANADTAFTKLTTLQPNHTAGYLWSGRAKAHMDPETELGLARTSYEKVIDIAQKTPEKSRNELIEAYSYLGYYHFLKEERMLSRSYWEKVLALNPSDQKAREALKALQ